MVWQKGTWMYSAIPELGTMGTVAIAPIPLCERGAFESPFCKSGYKGICSGSEALIVVDDPARAFHHFSGVYFRWSGTVLPRSRARIHNIPRPQLNQQQHR